MSEGITLTDELISKLVGVLHDHDQSVEQNMVVALQYFSAVNGYMLGDYPGTEHERNDLIDQLTAFTKHVADDRASQNQQQQQPAQPSMPAGRCIPTDDPALGIWKPET